MKHAYGQLQEKSSREVGRGAGGFETACVAGGWRSLEEVHSNVVRAGTLDSLAVRAASRGWERILRQRGEGMSRLTACVTGGVNRSLGKEVTGTY